jgi:hypothetical protein
LVLASPAAKAFQEVSPMVSPRVSPSASLTKEEAISIREEATPASILASSLVFTRQLVATKVFLSLFELLLIVITAAVTTRLIMEEPAEPAEEQLQHPISV